MITCAMFVDRELFANPTIFGNVLSIVVLGYNVKHFKQVVK
jgi:hypothetical protein